MQSRRVINVCLSLPRKSGFTPLALYPLADELWAQHCAGAVREFQGTEFQGTVLAFHKLPVFWGRTQHTTDRRAGLQ